MRVGRPCRCLIRCLPAGPGAPAAEGIPGRREKFRPLRGLRPRRKTLPSDGLEHGAGEDVGQNLHLVVELLPEAAVDLDGHNSLSALLLTGQAEVADVDSGIGQYLGDGGDGAGGVPVEYDEGGEMCIRDSYGSMASAITEKPEERTALSTFRGVGANLAQLVIGVLGPVIIYTTDVDGAQVIRGGGSIFPVVAGIFSVCAILCYVICYKCTTERVRIEKDPDAPKVTLLQTFATIFSSRAMLGIIGAALFLMLSQLLISGLNMYLYADYFGDVKAFSSYTFINIMLSLVLAGFVGRITGRMGKKEAAAVATAFTGAVYLVLFALKLTNPWIYMISSAIGFLGVNFFNLVIWANITDVIDDAEVRNGKREDGTIYAVYSFARKVGQALAGGLSGYAMGLIGYESAAKVQTAEVLNGLYTISTLVPALLFFCVTFMLLVVYPLNKKKVEENSEILQKRRAAR